MSKEFDLIGGLLMIGAITGTIITIALFYARRESEKTHVRAGATRLVDPHSV
jgi:hypothetical protein